MATTYMSRKAAVRAARNACKRALNAPDFQAAEGPDYAIHPQEASVEDFRRRCYERFSYELRGPAADAVKERIDGA